MQNWLPADLYVTDQHSVVSIQLEGAKPQFNVTTRDGWERVREHSPLAIGALEATTVRVSPRWRPKSRTNSLICHIDATAFVSVMFALLYMFILGAPPHGGHSGVLADIPKVSAPTPMRAALREDAMIVGVLRDGRVFFRTDKIAVDQLPSMIRQAVGQGAEKKIYIRADKRARYGTVKQVVDSVHDSGIENVGFLVDQRRPAPLPQ